MRWFVQVHAAERLIDRVDRSLSIPDAMKLVRRALGNASRLPGNTRDGAERWGILVCDVDVVAVVKVDHRMRKRAVVTLWRQDEDPDVFAGVDDDEVVEAYRRAMSASQDEVAA